MTSLSIVLFRQKQLFLQPLDLFVGDKDRHSGHDKDVVMVKLSYLKVLAATYKRDLRYVFHHVFFKQIVFDFDDNALSRDMTFQYLNTKPTEA